MSKNRFLLIIPIIIIVILFVSPQKPKTISIYTSGHTFSLEIAKTISQKNRGLSKRRSLCPNCGMLFIFNTENIYPFWMKDTLIPLDMIWLNSQNQIVSIETAQVQPNTPNSQLKIYQNTKPAMFIIELNGGTAQKLNLKVGDTIPISL